MPDGKSLIVPVGGKIQRVDFQTGKAAVIPFTARSNADIAPRLYNQYRIDDGATVERASSDILPFRLMESASPLPRSTSFMYGSACVLPAATDADSPRVSSCRRGLPMADISHSVHGRAKAVISIASLSEGGRTVTADAQCRILCLSCLFSGQFEDCFHLRRGR